MQTKSAAKKKSAENLKPIDIKIKKSLPLICVIVAVGVLVFVFGSMTANVIASKQLEEKCMQISKSPDLRYPCVCKPTTHAINSSDFVESRSENFCTCTCYLDNNETYVVEVRVAK